MRSFRLVCHAHHIPLVETLLHAEGFRFEAEPFSPWCRILTEEPAPLGSSLAAAFGCIYIQDRSSMLPPLALTSFALNSLAPSTSHSHGAEPAFSVLDMCASPGSKTGFLAQLTGEHGFVLGNEPTKSRLGTLRANMHHLGFLHVATCSYDGEKLPLLPNSWSYIQLDPPCSGWGTEEKNPHVRALWHGEKVLPLIQLQRRLLAKAWELLAPGGVVVYSTCTTNVEENELQVKYAMEELGFSCLPLPAFDGFVWEDSLHGLDGTLRVDGARSGAQGFYIAALQKPVRHISGEAEKEGTGEGAGEGAGEGKAACPPVSLFSPKEMDMRHLLDDISGIQSHLLPAGHVLPFGASARFVPAAACALMPAHMQWQAAKLGKYAGGNIRLSARCKTLLPQKPQHDAQHDISSSALILENLDDIRKLLHGQTVFTSLRGREAALYYGSPRGALPLGRITLKNGRALWSAK